MSIVDSTAKITPKSILRYRPIDVDATSPKSKTLATDSHPPVARASRLLDHGADKQSRSFVFYLLLGMSVTLVLWIVCTLFVGWATTWMDDLHYGRPRTFQTDIRVGHNNDQTGVPSHFIALNLNGNIEVIEFPGGDASEARTFAGPQLYGANDDLVPVTLTFADLNDDKKLDMIINFQNQHVVYLNDGKSFRLPLPDEQAEIEQALQRLGM